MKKLTQEEFENLQRKFRKSYEDFCDEMAEMLVEELEYDYEEDDEEAFQNFDVATYWDAKSEDKEEAEQWLKDNGWIEE